MLPNAKELRAETNKRLLEDAEKRRLEREIWEAGEPARKAGEVESILKEAERVINEAHNSKRTSAIVASGKTLYSDTAGVVKEKLVNQGFNVIVSTNSAEEYSDENYDMRPRPTGRYYTQTKFDIYW